MNRRRLALICIALVSIAAFSYAEERKPPQAAQLLSPGILYPYHLGDADTALLEKPLRQNTAVDIRMRDLQ